MVEHFAVQRGPRCSPSATSRHHLLGGRAGVKTALNLFSLLSVGLQSDYSNAVQKTVGFISTRADVSVFHFHKKIGRVQNLML